MPRPAIDVVVPFAGTEEQLRALHARLSRLRLQPDDTLTIVDNRRSGPHVDLDGIVREPQHQSSYYARNKGAARGSAPWIVFVDADLEVAPDLPDRLFDEPPADDTALLIGGIEVVPGTPTLVARYGWLSQHLNTGAAATSGWEYAQTANAAVRRSAFEAVGGFEACVRSGGDADLAFRLRRGGYRHEHRPAAIVRHPPRATLPALLRQFGRYGSGREWLHERYPEFGPPRSLPQLLVRTVKGGLRAVPVALRGDTDRALVLALNPAVALVTELGRFVPNERDCGIPRRVTHLARTLRLRRGKAHRVP